jgi:tetratricopeptide (TPR) repeat protein
MSSAPLPPVLQAIEALKRGERRQAATLLQQELRSGLSSPDRCRTIARLAAEIGEIETAIEASRRSLAPATLERLLGHWAMLASYGRADEATSEIERLEAGVREHPSVLHFRGTIASEQGRFEEAEELLRQALAAAPKSPASWFALAMIKTFEPGSTDIVAMESLLRQLEGAAPEPRARLYYALGKAWEDCGEYDRSFESYREGAAIRRQAANYDADSASAAANRVIRDFTAERMRELKPSAIGEQRSIFVTGLPRSGTTLVQQMLTAHSRVTDGDEVGLFKAALIPTLNYGFDGAIAYQNRTASGDPWGDIARDYAKFIDMRFRPLGLVVDKTLGQSTLTGLLLHALPDAKIVWLRREAEDAALSCFRTCFTTSTPWSWSIEDIANHFAIEDALFEHWCDVFGDRILVVPYERLVRNPANEIGAIARHVGLDMEPGMQSFHESERTVRTASVKQVRSPVATGRIGAANRYPQFIEAFQAAYRR